MRKTLSSVTFSPFLGAVMRKEGEDRGPAASVHPPGHHVRWLMGRGDGKQLVQSLLGQGYALVEPQDLTLEMPDPPGTPSVFESAGRNAPAVVQTTIPRLIQFPRPVFTPSKWPREPAEPATKPGKPRVFNPGIRLVHLEG